jgi:hypothetical protein
MLSLAHSDFNTTSTPYINLMPSSIGVSGVIVLFHDAKDIIPIFRTISRSVAGPTFAMIDMQSNPLISQAFTKLNSQTSNPYHKYAMEKTPFVIGYRNGWPVDIIGKDGVINEYTLQNFALNLGFPVMGDEGVGELDTIVIKNELKKGREENEELRTKIEELNKKINEYKDVINQWVAYSNQQTEIINSLQLSQSAHQ